MYLLQVSAFVTSDENLTDLGPKWDKWKRSIEYYIIGNGITGAKRKRSFLLYIVQDHASKRFSRPYIPEIGSETDYEAAALALTTYFKPMVNKFYGRYKFRQLEQESNKSIDQFVTKLRQQAERCPLLMLIKIFWVNS